MAVKKKTTETLIDAVHKISSSPDLDEVMDTIFDSLKEGARSSQLPGADRAHS